MNFALLAPRDQIVQLMNRIYYGGMTTLSGGNLSVKDDNGDIWITPTGVDKGRLMPKDIVCVKPDGSVAGSHSPSTEFPFHRAIYAKRPDIRAIVHAHAPALVSFSIVRRIPDTRIIPQAEKVCGAVGYAPYALPGSEMLGDHIAQAFGVGYDAVLLENHGAATAGNTLLEAFQRLETLDFCARSEMYAGGLGAISTLDDAQIAAFDTRDNLLPEFDPAVHSVRARELRGQMVDIVRRSCARQLMISTEGVVSARVDEADTFLITPTGYDRPNIEHADIVMIHAGKRERGKLPSRSVRLHQAIYDAHPDIECIISSQAPYATAYAIVDRTFDTKTIPESYVNLLDVPKLAYGLQFHEAGRAQIAAQLSARQPVILLENDCVLVTGDSVLKAFDRLEVAEFTARSLIETASIGDLVPISNEEITALEKKFLSM